MFFDYDVAIIGAGPVGSTLAYKLAKDGYNVAIFEKKREIGIPLQCAGIVSKKIHDFNEVPKELILNEVKGAYLHSLSYDLKVEKGETEALIIDRVAYDQFLAKRAQTAGVKIFKQYKVIYVDCDDGLIRCQNNHEIRAKVIVGADGSNSFVSKLFNNESNYFNASQYLVKTNLTGCHDDGDNFHEFVDLFAVSKILPGFLWLIPTSKNSYRIGLFSNNSYKEQKTILDDFLTNDNRFEDFEIIEKYNGKIPIFDKKKKFVNKRVILIGDAASQLKPTTGGGLIIGFDSCNIAKDAISKFIEDFNDTNTCDANYIINNNNNNFSILKEYEKNFKKKYSKELSYQIKVQQTINNLSDDDLDYMFHKLKEKGGENIISKYGDMDKQSILVKEFIKRGLIFSILPKIFFRKIMSIWNF